MANDKLSEQRRGSNGWAIDELLSRGLQRLIVDLRDLERNGFAEEICLQVREALDRISKGVTPGTGASFAPEIIAESGRFHQRYIDWNGNGTKGDESAIRSRRALIGELFFWRSRMMDKLRAGRKGFSIFATDDDLRIVRNVYEQLDAVVSKYPATFPHLKVSVIRFNAAMKDRDGLPDCA